MFHRDDGLWKKPLHTKDVTRWVVSAEVYKATLSSFCNFRGVGIWQWQGTLQYFASMSVSSNISDTGTHWLSFRSSAQAFPYFWEGLGEDKRAGAEGWACLAVAAFLPDMFSYFKKFSKTIGRRKEMLGWPALYHSNHMLFTICFFNRMADSLDSKAWQADASDISVRLRRLIR